MPREKKSFEKTAPRPGGRSKPADKKTPPRHARHKPAEGQPAAKPMAKKGGKPRLFAPRPAPIPHKPLKLPQINISPERRLDILGLLLTLLGLVTLLSLVSSNQSIITGWWLNSLRRLAGWGSLLLPFGAIGLGLWLVLRRIDHLPGLSIERIAGAVFVYFNLLAWLHILAGGGWNLANEGKGGGTLGAFLQVNLDKGFGGAGTLVILSGWLLLGIVLLLDTSIYEIILYGWRWVQRGINALKTLPQVIPPLTIPVEESRQSSRRGQSSSPVGELPLDFNPLPGQKGTPNRRTAAAREAGKPTQTVPAETTPAATADSPVVSPTVTAPLNWKLPTVNQILDAPAVSVVHTAIAEERSDMIEETLASLGAPAHVVEVHRGPTVTQYGVEPDFTETRSGKMRVRVSKIISLADDLALALAASKIRIQAPVPGRNYVGIEVPNAEVSRVTLREVMESDSFQKIKSPIRFALGMDVSGKPMSYDLSSMPHLLIAGTTGSGKSVCVNALLACLLMNNTPLDLRLVLVDPKRVELTGYNGIPHLLAPVVVDAQKVVGALQWMMREMDARYQRFAQVGARNIKEYNESQSPRLPYLVVVIDELADLMMLAPDETERSLTRLAQLARATGIHLIIATQRPSVDVLTGLIKANFPARIAFAVASSIDSRVILDQTGADHLLGRGDMLFQAPDAAAPVRLQGVWLSDTEIHRLVEYWKEQAYDLRKAQVSAGSAVQQPTTATTVDMSLPPSLPMHQAPLWDAEAITNPEEDPMLNDAIETIKKEGKASISMLQRRLRIGYTRAARMIDVMEARGIVGPAQATSQIREVLEK